MSDSEKLQKVIARAGIASRRAAESLIITGRVTVNGTVATLGDRVTASDDITVDGQSINTTQQATRAFVYNKPVGQIVAREQDDSVFDHFPPLDAGRWITIGRLDVMSGGLLLVTNDGELAHQWEHPSADWERVYQARVYGHLADKDIQRLLRGITDNGERLVCERLEPIGPSDGSNRWYTIVLKEGKNREVRRLFEAIGAKVNRLLRIGYGPFALPDSLAPGKWAELSPESIERARR